MQGERPLLGLIPGRSARVTLPQQVHILSSDTSPTLP